MPNQNSFRDIKDESQVKNDAVADKHEQDQTENPDFITPRGSDGAIVRALIATVYLAVTGADSFYSENIITAAVGTVFQC